MIISFTGHRPDKLGGYSEDARLGLGRFARCILKLYRPEMVISGMALGWDQAVAQAACDLGVPWTAAIPFENQPGRWPLSARQRWTELVSRATETKTICLNYSVQAMQLRNEWMVDNSDMVLALHDGSKGGTFNCIQYAHKRGKPVKNVWEAWEWFSQSQG